MVPIPELLDDMAYFLNAASLIDITAVSLTVPHVQLGMLQDAPNRAVALIMLPGMAPTETFGDGTLPTMERPRLQVFARWDPEDYLGTQTLARNLWKTLAVVTNQTINGTYYERIQAVSSPAVFDRDDQRRVVFVANFQITKALP